MKKAIFTFFGMLAAPLVAMAQQPNFNYVQGAVNGFQYYLERAIVIIMILMTVWFLWSIFKFIGEKDPTKMKDRKKQVVNGLIGLFLAVAVWGIIRIAKNIAGINDFNNQAPGLTCPAGYHDDGSGSCVR